MEKFFGQELLSLALSKLILTVAIIVCLGAIMGTIGYAIFHGPTDAEKTGINVPKKGIIKDGLAGWKLGDLIK